MRSANLPEDLGLTQNLGLESGRYAKEVPNGCLAIETVESGMQLNAVDAGELAKPPLEVLSTRPVDLESVAGGQDGGGATCGGLPFQPADHLGLYERQLFPHLHRGALVAHADDMKR
jgi:hypothetical protein